MTETINADFEARKQSMLSEVQNILGSQYQDYTDNTGLTRDGLELLNNGIGGVHNVNTHYGEMLVLCAGLLSRATKERMRYMQAVHDVA